LALRGVVEKEEREEVCSERGGRDGGIGGRFGGVGPCFFGVSGVVIDDVGVVVVSTLGDLGVDGDLGVVVLCAADLGVVGVVGVVGGVEIDWFGFCWRERVNGCRCCRCSCGEREESGFCLWLWFCLGDFDFPLKINPNTSVSGAFDFCSVKGLGEAFRGITKGGREFRD